MGFGIWDAIALATKTIKSRIDSGEHVPMHDIGVITANETHIGEVSANKLATVSAAQFARPANTTAYASGQLVADNLTAGSVTPLSFSVARVASGSVKVRRAKIKKSTNTTANASFRLHLYGVSPTVTNGDGGVWLSIEATYLGFIDVTMDKVFSDAGNLCVGWGDPSKDIGFKLSSGATIYGLLEARAAYAPGNAETFTVTLDVEQF